jgi:hypothetical protein
MKIAIMQPYFLPYAGYLKLLWEADLFVFFDCVQFPRRGWVHRNRYPKENGKEGWFSLPLQKSPLTTRIQDLTFRVNHEEALSLQLNQCLAIRENEEIRRFILRPLAQAESPLDYLIFLLQALCSRLDIQVAFERSSSLGLSDTLKGHHRIIAIAKAFGADEYLNLSGGKDLYKYSDFEDHEISLSFLKPFAGPRWSIGYRLAKGEEEKIKKEIQ